jgi:hypothetical protein
MKLRTVATLTLILLLPLSMSAQKKKKRVGKKPAVEIPKEDPRITNMREMTQQIIIVDSIVTDKNQFLPHLRVSHESGTVMSPRQFLNKSQDDSTSVFVNEMGNKAYFSLPDDSLRQQLYTIDKLGGEWSRPMALQGISDGINEAAYPFMLTDGITFYFAGKGEESIGGYDIFFTRYDSHTSRFLKPENLGMPFNSEANDYMYAIDEYNRIGYFVSDRHQPEGKVCIYIFVPSDSRKTYDLSAYTEQQMRGFADISRIADTWGDGKERQAALARLKNLRAAGKNSQSAKTTDSDQLLVISDALTYSSAKDFRSREAAALYEQLVNARKQLSTINKELDSARDDFAKANASDREGLKKEILLAEKEVLQLTERVKTLEKQARNTEIKVIN